MSIAELHLENLRLLLENKDSLRTVYDDIQKDLGKLDDNYWDFYYIIVQPIREIFYELNELNEKTSLYFVKCHNYFHFCGFTDAEEFTLNNLCIELDRIFLGSTQT